MKAELRSLPRSLADLVAQHLVASGQLLDQDPELAYLHAKTARRLAARLGGVREAVAITAYLSEHYDEALTEFRAVRRMTGNHEVLPMMADCERALGRPEKALALSREKQVHQLEEASQIEMLIVAAGARRDMGQTAAAIQTLDVPELTKRTRAEWLPRLRYAYADALAEAGRTEDALVWFHRAAGADADGSTGAAERAAELEGLQFTDLDDDDDDDYDDETPEDLADEDLTDQDLAGDEDDLGVAGLEDVQDDDLDDEDEDDEQDEDLEDSADLQRGDEDDEQDGLEDSADLQDEDRSGDEDLSGDEPVVDDALDGEVDLPADVDEDVDEDVDQDVDQDVEGGQDEEDGVPLTGEVKPDDGDDFVDDASEKDQPKG
ncbi:hypothetical protein GCM10009744_08710 [Kribbella alba]|uniref:Replicase polyprotein 1ab n=1 Tax=Kribbella alba TaxID=190197 RepID=A0ABN2EZG9_9ACTN